MSNSLKLEDLPESVQIIAANALSRAIEGQWDEDNRALAANIAGAFITLYVPAESGITVKLPAGMTKEEVEAAMRKIRNEPVSGLGIAQ